MMEGYNEDETDVSGSSEHGSVELWRDRKIDCILSVQDSVVKADGSALVDLAVSFDHAILSERYALPFPLGVFARFNNRS